MAEGNGGGGGMGILGVLVGALIVIGLVMFFMGGFGGSAKVPTGGGNATVTVNPPASAPAAPNPATPAPAPAAPAAPKQ